MNQDELYQDIITSQERVAQFNKDEEPIDYMIEVIVKTVIVTITAILMMYGLIMWVHEDDFSDTGVGCVNDCLEPGNPFIEGEVIR